MQQKELSELTDEQLLKEAKSIKNTKLIDATVIGLLIGVAIFSIVKKGVGLFTFLPLVYIPIATKNKVKINEIEKLLKQRNLK